MIGMDKRAKLIDFGISRFVDKKSKRLTGNVGTAAVNKYVKSSV